MSLKSRALLPSLQRFVGCLIRRCLQLTMGHLRALCFIDVTCLMFVTLHASCGTVYCNQSCLFVGWVGGGSVTAITQNFVYQSSLNWVCKGSDRLQLIKFWPSHTPGRGSAAGQHFLAPPYYIRCAVFASPPSAFSFLFCFYYRSALFTLTCSHC